MKTSYNRNGFLVYLKEEEKVDLWNDLVPNPTVVKKIVFNNLLPQIYESWEASLLKQRTMELP